MIMSNTVYNCDCLELIDKMIEDGLKADMLLTDIPYDACNRDSNGLRNLDYGKADVATFDLLEFLDAVDIVTKNSFVVFCEYEQVSTIVKYFRDMGYTVRVLVWEKTNPSPMNGKSVYLSGVELAVWAKKSGGTFNAHCKNTVFRYPLVGVDRIHPTMKNLALFMELIKDNTNEGDLVLDTCMGSFTTAVACKRLGRRYIGAELDKGYYEKGKARLDAEENQLTLFDV